MSNGKFEELESIRGVAALLVVLVHVPKWGGFMDWQAIKSFALMVDLFFVLSGFVIFWNYGQRLHSAADVMRFQFMRFGRLYPVHLVFLLLYAGLELAKLYASQSQGVDVSAVPFSHNTPARLLQHIFLVQALPPHSEWAFNSPSWSISAEFYTYLLFAILVLLARRKALVVFAAIATATSGALAFDYTAGMEPVLRCWAGFFVGCLTAGAYRRYLHAWQLPPAAPWIAVSLLAVYVVLRPPTEYGFWIYPLSAATLVSVLCSRPNLVRSALQTRPMVLLGTLSYSIYMAHHILVSLFEIVLNRVLHIPAGVKPAGGYIAALSGPQAAVTFAVFFGVLLGVSLAVYRWIEVPCRQASRQLAAKRPRVSDSAFAAGPR